MQRNISSEKWWPFYQEMTWDIVISAPSVSQNSQAGTIAEHCMMVLTATYNECPTRYQTCWGRDKHSTWSELVWALCQKCSPNLQWSAEKYLYEYAFILLCYIKSGFLYPRNISALCSLSISVQVQMGLRLFFWHRFMLNQPGTWQRHDTDSMNSRHSRPEIDSFRGSFFDNLDKLFTIFHRTEDNYDFC